VHSPLWPALPAAAAAALLAGWGAALAPAALAAWKPGVSSVTVACDGDPAALRAAADQAQELLREIAAAAGGLEGVKAFLLPSYRALLIEGGPAAALERPPESGW
jgi:hypothetical protein